MGLGQAIKDKTIQDKTIQDKSNVIVDEEGAQAGVNYKSNVIGDEEGGQAGHGLKEETEETEKIYKTGWDIGIPK